MKPSIVIIVLTGMFIFFRVRPIDAPIAPVIYPSSTPVGPYDREYERSYDREYDRRYHSRSFDSYIPRAYEDHWQRAGGVNRYGE